MKTMTRVIAAVMLVAIFATMMTACGKKKADDEKGYIDDRIIGTWKDETTGATWTFKDDYTCTLSGGPNKEENASGTYKIADLSNGKMDITLKAWDAAKPFTYVATEKVIDLETFEDDYCFYGKKQ